MEDDFENIDKRLILFVRRMLHENRQVSIKTNGDVGEMYHPVKWRETLNIMLSVDKCEIFIKHTEGKREGNIEHLLWINMKPETSNFLGQWAEFSAGGWVEEYVNDLKIIKEL